MCPVDSSRPFPRGRGLTQDAKIAKEDAQLAGACRRRAEGPELMFSPRHPCPDPPFAIFAPLRESFPHGHLFFSHTAQICGDGHAVRSICLVRIPDSSRPPAHQRDQDAKIAKGRLSRACRSTRADAHNRGQWLSLVVPILTHPLRSLRLCESQFFRFRTCG